MTRPRVPKRPRGANLPKAETLRVLRFLTQYQAEHGMAPTARELAEGLGYSSPSVAQYRLDALLERGLVVVDVGKSRSVRVTEAGMSVSDEERRRNICQAARRHPHGNPSPEMIDADGRCLWCHDLCTLDASRARIGALVTALKRLMERVFEVVPAGGRLPDEYLEAERLLPKRGAE